jgi:hypothetical protein
MTRKLGRVIALYAVMIVGCSDSTEVMGTPAYDVIVAASNHGTTQFGDSITIRLINHGGAAAYFMPCGASPAFQLTRLENGQWVSTGAVACPLTLSTGPIVLAAGDSLTALRYLADAGRYRAEVTVFHQSTLSDPLQATSNSVVVVR